MKGKQNHIKPIFSVFMCLMLLLPLWFPQTGNAIADTESRLDGSSHVHNSNSPSENKISQDLMKKFTKDDQVTFLLKFKEQVNPKEIAEEAINKAQKNGLSSAKTELNKRTAIVSSLRATSLETQDSVTSYLEEQKEAGEIKSFESFYIVNAMAVTGTKKVAEELSKFSQIEKILPNRTRQLITEDDSDTQKKPQQKTSEKVNSKSNNSNDDEIEPNIEQVGAPQVWDEGITGSGVVVASLDTGVQWDHPALKEKYRGYDPEKPNQPHNEFNWFDAVDGKDMPYDDLGHGTHTVGTMVGSEPDGTNQVGVAPDAEWIAVNAFTAVGATDADLLSAGEWILAPKDSKGNPHPEKSPDIVNNSWGGGPGLNEWYRPMVQAWREAGIFPVFAAGNTTPENPGGPGSVTEPGNYPESFTVGAVNAENQLAAFSLLGPSPYEEIKPDVVAPGVGIRSAVPGSGYDGTYNGTSMATPAVAGAVALLKQADASLTVDEIEQIFMNTATPLTDEDFPESPNNGYGQGIINAFNAVSTVTSGLGYVEGKVIEEGEDNQEPTFQHEKPEIAYETTALPLEISVQDNVGIEKVQLQYRTNEDVTWQSLEAEQVEGSYNDGMYSANIPGKAIEKSSIEYKWDIVDYGENNVTSDIYEVEVKSSVTVGYQTDFEDMPYGWVSYGDTNNWEWGEPNSGPHDTASGEKVYATKLEGDYKNNGDMTLMMPPIDLPEGESYLQFKQWFSFGDDSDLGQVLISTDQENWETLDVSTGRNNHWEDNQVNLSHYADKRVYISFHVQSDDSVTDAGWYLDDVALSDTPLDDETESPTYQHQKPSKAYGGMNLPVQIAVQDNSRIGQVVLEHRETPDDEWTKIQTKLVEGQKSNGVYEAIIPDDAFSKPSITYRWKISDYGGNEQTTDLYEVPVESGITIGYRTDFESDPSWLTFGTNNSWERGIPTSGPGDAISGENVYGTNLDGNYQNYADMTLIMPPIDLTKGEAYLQFKHWYEFEDNYAFDFGEVLVSTDQENWETLAKFPWQSQIWQYLEVDLSDYAEERVYVAFHAVSDSRASGAGWYLDDVTLSDTSIFENNKADYVQPHMKGQKALNKVKAEKTLNKENHKKTKKDTKLKGIFTLDTVKPIKLKNIKSPISSEENMHKENSESDIQTIPLDSTVSVLETGRSVHTNIKDGSYSLILPKGKYTLQADTYGYNTGTQSVEVTNEGTVEANFSLQPIPKGVVSGTVMDKVTGEPMSNATLMLMEDAAIAPVHTDENGDFSITAYEGDYTLHVLAPNYHSDDIQITIHGDQTTEQNITLKPFIGYPGEIGYDDGTAEGSRAFYDAGDGWAVKMSLSEGHDNAMVTGGKFLFDETWPNPGGTDFQIEIWDSSGPDGAPGKKLLGPIDATALRNGEWTIIDLTEYGLVVKDDFYIASIQAKDHPYAPGISADEDGSNAQHSWGTKGGKWEQSPVSHGNYMIRALIDYEMTPPEITSPKNDRFTNEETIKLEGEAAPTTEVTIFNNEEEVTMVETTSDGTFSTDIPLTNGENVITTTASTKDGTTQPSEPISITLDQDKPKLTIDSPEDDWKTDEMAVEVKGTATDANLVDVKVNGEEADVEEDGSYSHRMLLNDGENIIKATTTDKAGNTRSKQITVYAKFKSPKITNLKPAEDKYLSTGESVKIEMDSESNLNATFTVQRPLGNTPTEKASSFTELPMKENGDGHYIGYWTVPSDWAADEAQISVIVKDDYGHKTEKQTDGSLYINVPNDKPKAKFDVPKKVRKHQSVPFDGTDSQDVDGAIVKYEWDFGDGKKANGEKVKHQFLQKGKFKVTLKVTDNRGATDTIKKKVHVLNSHRKPGGPRQDSLH